MPEKFIRSKAQTREDFQRVPPLHSQSLDLSSLTEQEERIIQAVIQKDELERSILDAKISEVRKEIQELRKAGALTSGDNQNAICARCKYKFPSFIMPLADHGQRCVSCKFRVCKKCSSREPSGMWLCVLCLKYRQEKLLTGEWMSKGESIGLQGSDLLRVSLRDRNPSSHRKLPVVTKKADVVLAVKKNKVSETVKLFQQRRDSYTHAVENQRATVAAPKGNPDKRAAVSARHGGATDMHDHTVASSLEQTKHLTHQSPVSTKACSYEDLTNTSLPSFKTTPGGASNVPQVLPEKFRFKRKLSEDQRKLSSSSSDVLSSFDQPTSSVAAEDGAPTPSRPDRKSDGLGKPTYALTNTSSPVADEDKQRKQLPSTGDSFEKLYDQNVNRLVELMSTSGDHSGKKSKRELPQTPPNGKSKEFLLQKSLSLSDEVAASLVYVSFDTDDYHCATLDHKNNKMVSPHTRNQGKKAPQGSADRKDHTPSHKQPQEEQLVLITTQVAKNETVAKKDKAPVVQDKNVNTKLEDTTIKVDSKLVALKPEQPSAVESLVENLAKRKWLDQSDKASANLCRSSSNVSDTFSSVTEISEQWGEADSLPYDSDSTMHEKVFDDSFVVDEEDCVKKPGVDVYKSEFKKNNGHGCGVELDASEHESYQSSAESSADSTQNTTQLFLAHHAPESGNPEGYASDKDSSVDSQLSALESDQGFLNLDLLNASKEITESGSENTVSGQVKEKKVKPNKNESKLKLNVHLFGKRKLERKKKETENTEKNENLRRKEKNVLGGNYLPSDHTASHRNTDDNSESYKTEAKVTLLSLALRRKLEEEQNLHDLELSSNLPEATLDLDSCTSSHSSVCDDSAMRSDSDELVRDSDSSVTSNNTSKSNTPDPRLLQQQRNHADQQRSRTEQQKTAPEQPKVKPEQQKTVQEQPKARSEQQKAGQESQKSTEQQKVRLKSLAEQQLQVPAIAVTQSGDEREEDDDLDELFGNHRPQLLGSRSSLADSRESIYSVYSDAGEVNYGKIPVTGDIFFNLNYNVKSSALEIHIKQCRNLAPVDTKHGRSDPYIKTYLLPDKTRSSKRKTKIKKHTLNPTFDEVLKYSITPAELESRTLWVTVWHNDRFGRNDFLGEVTIPLDYYRFDENAPRWYPLQERSMSQESESPVLAYKGDLFISLKYIPADMVDNAPKKKSGSFRKKSKEKEKPKAGLGEVHVLVREAQNLTAMRANAGSNPFCKGYLLPDVSRSSKQKTPVIKKTTNPQWNHILVFEGVDQSQLQQHGLELTVWDHEKLSSNDFLGGVRLNLGQGTHQGKPVDWMDAKGEEIEAWQSMLERPNEWIDAQLPLRASMGKQNVKK
ncbi:synaptotagmin-like protein 5 isoform X2 [Physella acuta]|uniref:synaptotagmin-like protein 5 isoform X2 n=1 Tax=Physella acuta TaxID=109671 RepID=UPI0027DD2C2A|nr:synaptotagmin-like protein 5 isoform X2 [Physella acuta]